MSGSRRRGAETCSVDTSKFMSLLYKCNSVSSHNPVEVMQYSALQGIALKNETPFLMGCKDMLRISEETQTHFCNVGGTAAETTTVLVLHEKGIYREGFIVQEDHTLDQIFSGFRAGLKEWQACTSGIAFAFLHPQTCKSGSPTPQHPPLELIDSHVTVQDVPKTAYSSRHSNLMFHRAERVIIACDDEFLIRIRSPIRRYDMLLDPDPAFDFLRFAEFTYRASPFLPLEQVFADHCAIQEIDRQHASFYLMTCDDRALWPIVHGTEALHDLPVDGGFKLHVHVEDPGVHVSVLPAPVSKPEMSPSRGLYWEEFARAGLDVCDVTDQFRKRNRQMQGLDLHGCKKFLSNQDMIASHIVTNMTVRFFALQQAVTGAGDVDIHASNLARDNAMVENAFFVHYWEQHEQFFSTWTERAVSLYLSARWDDFQLQKCTLNDAVMALARKEAEVESKSRAVAELQERNTKRHAELLKCLRNGQQRQGDLAQKEQQYAAEAERFHKQVQELKKNQERHMAAVDKFQDERKKLEGEKVEFRLKKMQLEERLVGLDILEADLQCRIQSVEMQKESLGALLAKSEKQETEAKEKVDNIKDHKKKLCSREAIIRQREVAVEDREAAVGDREAAVEDLEAVVEDLEAAVGDREAVVEDREAALEDREAAVEDREAAFEEREAAWEQREDVLEDREMALGQREAAFAEREAALGQREAAFAEREAALGQREAAFTEREVAVEDREAAVQKQREQFDDDLRVVQETKQQFQDIQNQLVEKGDTILALENQLSESEARGMCDAATQMDTAIPNTSAVDEYIGSIFDLLCLHCGRYAGKIAGMLREHLAGLGLKSMNEDDLFVFVSQSVKVLSTLAKAAKWSFNTNANDLLNKLQSVDFPEQDDICNFMLSQLDPAQILVMAPGIDDLKNLVSEIRESQQFTDWLLCEEYLLFVRMAMEKQAEQVLAWQSSAHRQEAAKTACMAELQVYPTKTMIARKIHSWIELELSRLDDLIELESDFITRYVKNERLYKVPAKEIVEIFAMRHPGVLQEHDVGLIFQRRSSRVL